jgi:acetylornithine deacetylase
MVFLADVASIKFGPGDSRRSHTADEFVTAEELRAGTTAYERMIQAYFEAVGSGVHDHSAATPAKGSGRP